MKDDTNYHDSMPIGLAMSLAQNVDAMNNFSALPQDVRSRVLANARRMTTRDEMMQIVRDLAKNDIH